MFIDRTESNKVDNKYNHLSPLYLIILTTVELPKEESNVKKIKKATLG